MRYVYGITAALLLGGSAATLTLNSAGAQTAQNEPGTIQGATPRPGAGWRLLATGCLIICLLRHFAIQFDCQQLVMFPSGR